LCCASTGAGPTTDSALACNLRLRIAHRIVASLSQYFTMEYSVTAKMSASGTPRWKLYLAVLLWLIAAVCAVSLFRELPWTTNVYYRDFTEYYRPSYLLRQHITLISELMWVIRQAGFCALSR
jgi:hypothetical protein